jgi:hypothetical protein
VIISSRPVTSLGAPQGSRLRFGEEPKPPEAWAGRRLLWLDDRPAFELTLWCGTCPFIFRRLGAWVGNAFVASGRYAL